MYTCACGEAFTSAGDLESHLIDMFTPETDTGNDGQDHYEAVTAQTAHDAGGATSAGVRM